MLETFYLLTKMALMGTLTGLAGTLMLIITVEAIKRWKKDKKPKGKHIDLYKNLQELQETQSRFEKWKSQQGYNNENVDDEILLKIFCAMDEEDK